VKLKHLTGAGVEQVARVAGVQGGLPVLDDGLVLEVTNVIWCTGFRQDFGWIDVPAFGEDGTPIHERGVAKGSPRPVLHGSDLPVRGDVRRAAGSRT
jgi:putative flavoprotein involved in K+ transport